MLKSLLIFWCVSHIQLVTSTRVFNRNSLNEFMGANGAGILKNSEDLRKYQVIVAVPLIFVAVVLGAVSMVMGTVSILLGSLGFTCLSKANADSLEEEKHQYIKSISMPHFHIGDEMEPSSTFEPLPEKRMDAARISKDVEPIYFAHGLLDSTHGSLSGTPMVPPTKAVPTSP